MELARTSRTRPFSWHALACCIVFVAACGDDAQDGAAAGDGCTTDVECKGDRICVDRQCVDPEDAPPDTPDGGGGGAGRSAARQDGGVPPRAGSGAAGRSGAAGNPVIDDPELEHACSLDCEARHAASCSMNIGSLDQCLAQCLIIDEANQGFCLEEQTDLYACRASGGYACVSGYPQPKATCIVEAQAVSQCSQKAPCRRLCERKASVCGDENPDCESECLAEQNGFEDAICGIYYTQLVTCWGQNLVCEEGSVNAAMCGGAISEVADCIGRRNTDCDGFCWAAELIGCGSESCVEDCKAKIDETSCGHYYRSVIDCAIGSHMLNVSCEDGEPIPSTTGCSSQIQQYESCMNPN